MVGELILRGTGRRAKGFTELIFDEATHRIGGGIVGVHADELIFEVPLAIEMGSEAADMGLTVHAHPPLSESICMAAKCTMAQSAICTCQMKK